MQLTDLKHKQQARIASISGPVALRQRLVALGVLRGLCITVSATSLMGNPRAYSIGKQKICLRGEDAEHIQIELLPR